MIAWLRSILLNINSSYWFFPAMFSLLAAALAIAMVYLDRNGAAEWLLQYDWLHPSRPSGAATTLSVIAGSMIGVASTVFSITIAAVAYASGNYGPRLLTNFMEDRGNQLSLATFIGTFVYALMVLRVVREEGERPAGPTEAAATSLPGFTPQLSLLVAMVLAMLAVAVLVYFLHHIPASIRINSVLQGIGMRLVNDIKDRYPEAANDAEPREQAEGKPVSAIGYGYITIIDFDGLNEVAERHGATIALKLRTGDFIHPKVPLAEVSGVECDDGVCQDVRECFSSGALRTPTQDLEFLIDELAEIALRALSPGINDPFTAIAAMDWMGAAVAELGRRDLDRGPEQQDYEWDRVQPLPDDFEHYVHRGFGTMRAGVATNSLAAMHFISSIYASSSTCKAEGRRKALLAEAEEMVATARQHLAGPELIAVEKRLAELRDEMPVD